MIVAVLDSNVLLAGFASHEPTTATARVIDSWRASRFAVVTSEHIIAEMVRGLGRRYFRRRMSSAQTAAALELLRRHADLTPLTVIVHGIATHREDDVVLATAVSARAEYLVTGDKKLQTLASYEGVRIVSPREFVQLLEAQEQGGGESQ